MSHIHMCAKCFAAYECRQPHMGAEPSECDWCRDGITDDLVKATNEQNDPTDPTAEARAAALVEEWIKAPAEKPRPDFHGTSRYDATTCMFMIDECKKAPLRRLIALALDAFRKERVERAEKDAKAANDAYLKMLDEKRALEAELARVREERDAAYAIRDAGWEQTEGVIKERDALRARLSPERLRERSEAVARACDRIAGPQACVDCIEALLRELGQ